MQPATNARRDVCDVPELVRRARAQADRAAALMDLRVAEAHSAAQTRDVVAVLNQIWGSRSDAGVVDLGSLVAMAHSGNYVVRAYVRDDVVGGGAGFFGPPGAPFHSHIVGVLPSVAAHGVGRAIKLHQRAWCLERGVPTMTWTYDPLVARNAHFNIRKLGALPVSHHRDFYGEMSDGINAGQFTDRMLISWDLTGPVPDSTGGAASPPGDSAQPVVALAGGDGVPGSFTPPPADHDGPVLVGVPSDIESIRHTDPDRAAAWRVVTREAFGTLMDNGWHVRDFRASHYVFGREGHR